MDSWKKKQWAIFASLMLALTVATGAISVFFAFETAKMYRAEEFSYALFYGSIASGAALAGCLTAFTAWAGHLFSKITWRRRE